MASKSMFQTVAQLRRNCDQEYGLDFDSAIEMAYENATAIADDLHKRLQGIAAILETVDNRAMAADGPVTKTRDEITDAEYRKIYRLAKVKR